MQELFKKYGREIIEAFEDYDAWDTLVINKRKPHTYRAFTSLPDGHRLCIHYFDVCDAEEAFAHPHGWDAEFLVLDGAYRETLWFYPYLGGLDGGPEALIANGQQIRTVDSVYTAGSWHRIANNEVWHKVQPLGLGCRTLMINGPPYPNPRPAVRTTRGKDLETMSDIDTKLFINKAADLYIDLTLAI